MTSQVIFTPCSEGGILVAEAASQIHENSNAIVNPVTRSVELFANDLKIYKTVRAETIEAVIDEELTNAGEDIAKAKSDYGVVPRTYYQRGNDLVDAYGNSLSDVHEVGINWGKEELEAGKAGAEWELKRRQTEQANFQKLVAMDPGNLFIEVSSTPLEKPAQELESQGYNGMTFIRASAKEDGGITKQRNIILPTSEPKFLLRIQSLLEVPIESRTIDSQEILGRPVVRQMSFEELDSLVGVAVLESMPDHAVLSMLKKAVGARREAWEFISSNEHEQLRQELAEKITELATMHPNWWLNGMLNLRKGFLKELRERYDGRISSARYGDVIGSAAAQAVVDGDVFITCGGAIESASPVAATNDSRSNVAKKLRNEIQGSGACSACGAKGKLYGCGVFCKACNDVWCNKFEVSGEQLSAKQIRYLRFMKFNNSAESGEKLDLFDELARYWQNLKQAAELKRLRKQREQSVQKVI